MDILILPYLLDIKFWKIEEDIKCGNKLTIQSSK